MIDDDRRVASTARALALVEQRLRDAIDVAAMADAACYSLFHFIRVFTELTGHGPYDYLMRRRIAEAAKETVSGNRPLIDIALDYGFESPDGFTRAFKRCFGLAPSDARRLGSYPERYARTAVDVAYAERLLGSRIVARRHCLDAMRIAGDIVLPSLAYPTGSSVALIPTAGREPRLALAGRMLGSGEPQPSFPIIVSAIAAGDSLSVSSPKPLDLAFAREYLYRTILPVSQAMLRDELELIGLSESGEPLSLSVFIRCNSNIPGALAPRGSLPGAANTVVFKNTTRGANNDRTYRNSL